MQQDMGQNFSSDPFRKIQNFLNFQEKTKREGKRKRNRKERNNRRQGVYKIISKLYFGFEIVLQLFLNIILALLKLKRGRMIYYLQNKNRACKIIFLVI